MCALSLSIFFFWTIPWFYTSWTLPQSTSFFSPRPSPSPRYFCEIVYIYTYIIHLFNLQSIFQLWSDYVLDSIFIPRTSSSLGSGVAFSYSVFLSSLILGHFYSWLKKKKITDPCFLLKNRTFFILCLSDVPMITLILCILSWNPAEATCPWDIKSTGTRQPVSLQGDDHSVKALPSFSIV